MPTSNTPSIASLQRAIVIAEQIERLQAQLAALVGGNSAGGNATAARAPRAASATPRKRRKRTMSADARERIASAQRARWAKVKGVSKAPAAAAKKPAKKKSGLTPEGRAKLAAAMKARWAARKKGAAAPNAGKK